jgi:hypothetical protein
VTVWSYLDRLYVAVLGCPDQLDDLPRFTGDLAEALAELEATSPAAGERRVGQPIQR